jgi:hypothetical protein
MKESKNNDSSRRDFIKTSAKLAIGSTLVGGVSPEVNAQTNCCPNPVAHQGDVQNYFKGKMKLPGWLPDLPQGDDTFLFPEEALHQDKKGFDAFPPPNSFPNIFQEPLPQDAWILGAPFNKDQNSGFDLLLEQLLTAVRHYNAALYWMRRLHFHLRHVLEPDKFKISTAPPRNPHGDGDDLANDKDLATWELKDFGDPADTTNPTRTAEQNWHDALVVLTGALTAPKTFSNVTFNPIYADVVQVNSYIVSIRVVAIPTARGREMGGSSSSHISISSAFSSP